MNQRLKKKAQRKLYVRIAEILREPVRRSVSSGQIGWRFLTNMNKDRYDRFRKAVIRHPKIKFAIRTIAQFYSPYHGEWKELPCLFGVYVFIESDHWDLSDFWFTYETLLNKQYSSGKKGS